MDREQHIVADLRGLSVAGIACVDHGLAHRLQDRFGAIERLDLSRMTVVPERGGFFELGSIWLVVDKMGARPRLVTVNRQALDEAAGAARRKAQDRQGEPVPDL